MRMKLLKTNHFKFRRQQILHRVLVANSNPNQLSQKIGISIKNEYVKAQMRILYKSDDFSLIERILDKGYFSFTYNDNEIKNGDKDFPDLG